MSQLLPMLFALAGGVCLVLVMLALWHSVRALLGGSGSAQSALAGERESRSALAHEKDVLLGALRELRFERDLGKVSEADFAQLDQRYRGRAREVLRLLDEDLAPYRERARALIEGAREAAPSKAVEPTGANDNAGNRAPVAASHACAGCGTQNDADATFCKKCGAKLTPTEPT